MFALLDLTNERNKFQCTNEDTYTAPYLCSISRPEHDPNSDPDQYATDDLHRTLPLLHLPFRP